MNWIKPIFWSEDILELIKTVEHRLIGPRINGITLIRSTVRDHALGFCGFLRKKRARVLFGHCMVKRFVVSDCGHSIEPEVVVAQALVVYSRFFAFGRPEKVQPLTVWIGTDAPLEMILTRWDNLQNSQQELERLAQTTT